MSPPAENAFSPAPVITMQPIVSSASAALTASRSSSVSWLFMALSWSERFMVRIATPRSCSTRMYSYAMADLPPRGAQLGGGVGDRADDLVVAGAAAQVAGQPVADLGLVRVRVAIEQRLG